MTVIQDKNMNGDLDTGFLRLPKEPYGFSNNYRSSFGSASWKDAKFLIDSKEKVLTVRVK